MTPQLILYYAPDNASLCVRLALNDLGLAYRTILVDRAQNGQSDPAYLALNPNGLIPTLITPDGPIYETAAILLWLADTYADTLFPSLTSPSRGAALGWLFWLSNTLHPAMRAAFYPDKYIETAQIPALLTATRSALSRHFAHLEAHAGWLDDRQPSILSAYLCPMIRWAALYGAGPRWFELHKYPRLAALATWAENQPNANQARLAEGLGQTIFTNPQHPDPPEGSAI